MCDLIIKKNLKEDEIPQYVYKRVQKTPEGTYISPVMGEPMPMNKWLKAPKRDVKTIKGFKSTASLINFINRKYPKAGWINSSAYSKDHNGMWGSFQTKEGASNADLISNFADKSGKKLPTVVVRCEVKGTIHESRYDYSHPTFMSTHIRIVGEEGPAKYSA